MMEKQNAPRSVAIFDLDKTITRYDTYICFLLSILRKKPLRTLRCIHLPLTVLMFKLKLRNNSWLKATFFTAIAAGLDRQEVKSLSQTFVSKVLKNGVYQEALKHIKKHKAAGDHLVLASASFNVYVDLLAKALEFDHTICTQAQWDQSSRLTGRIDGQNCYGENKHKAVQSYLAEIENKGKVTMYSDHDSDLAVFLLSDVRIAVNPGASLAKKAATYGITVVHWE